MAGDGENWERRFESKAALKDAYEARAARKVEASAAFSAPLVLGVQTMFSPHFQRRLFYHWRTVWIAHNFHQSRASFGNRGRRWTW